jgi:ComF family protein
LCEARLHPFEQRVCDPCRAALLVEDTWRCRRCGATGTGDPPRRGQACDYCPPPGAGYEGTLAATHYNDPVSRCVHLYKYHRRMELGDLMADMMIARLAEALAALEGRAAWIVPVPLHWMRRARRGFNQSARLAARMAEALPLEPRAEALRRIRYTPMQTHIPPERRAANVAGAFAVPAALRDRLPGVLLVDDVVTSGSTAAECARTLRAAGAPQVWVAAFARARPSAPATTAGAADAAE